MEESYYDGAEFGRKLQCYNKQVVIDTIGPGRDLTKLQKMAISY